MIQFFSPEIAETLLLPESDSSHAVRVLRLSQGDKIEVVDGKGNRYKCIITDAHQKKTRVEILEMEKIVPSWNKKITVAVAPTKHLDRMEWLVEKLTEIGFDRFVPLRCRFSERKELKSERLEKIAVSAMKQSLKATLPVIEEITPFSNFIENDKSEQKFIAYCNPDIPRRVLANEYDPLTSSVTILIGPEGDFSENEIDLALSSGYCPVTLGESRLRTETAALMACATFHIVDSISSQSNE